MKYHSVDYNFRGKSKYEYSDALIYVQDLIIKYLTGYFENN